MPLTVLFELTIEEGAADAREVVAATLAQTAAFPGNDGVEVVVDDADPLRIVCVLHWADQPAYDAYIAWRRTPEGAHRLGEVIAGPPSTRRFSTRIPV